MVFPTVLIVLAAAIVGLSWYLGTKRDRRSLFRAAVYIGCTLGVVRAGLASFGWYVVEHTGGPLQVPAFALAMLAWPEAAIFTERRTTPAPPEFYLRLSLLLFVSTVMLIGMVAAVAASRHDSSRRQARE